MFTLDQIKTRHAQVKSGADFPGYIQDLITLGVVGYSTYVSDGHTVYVGQDNYGVQTVAKYAALVVAAEYDIYQFIHALKIHQQGQTDYLNFCNDCAKNGVEKWVVDMHAMTCSYFDMAGRVVLVEGIPLL